MAFNINEFRSVIHQKGVAKNNLFEALVVPPSGIQGGDVLKYECESASIPDLGVNVENVKPHGFGHGVNRPVSAQFQDLQCNFIVDGEFSAKEFFYAWMQEVVNYDNSNYGVSTNGLLPYEFGFMNDYAGSVNIKVWPDNKEDKYYEHKFGNAYPVNIGSVELSWANEAEIMILPVTFAYNIYSNSTIHS